MFISDFETTAAEIAIEQSYHVVVCGHIHQPVIKRINTTKGSVQYMNSGDWVENLTALEYENKKWRMFNYHRDYKAVEQLQMEFKEAV
jgi:UDP-2,3-diacylglucosamine pyrophosphatase LpxH